LACFTFVFNINLSIIFEKINNFSKYFQSSNSFERATNYFEHKKTPLRQSKINQNIAARF